MSPSMYGAGRTTHLKVVVLSLLCAIVFAVVGPGQSGRDGRGASDQPS